MKLVFKSLTRDKIQPSKFAAYTLAPILITGGFYWLSPNEITLAQLAMAFVLLQIPWSAYLSWKKRTDQKLPIFALIAFMYWIYYAVSLFWGARTVSGIDTHFDTNLPEDSITWSLALALTGVISLWLGMKSGLGKRLTPGKLPELKEGMTSRHYLRVLLILGTLLSFWEGLPYAAGEGGRQALTIIISLLPLLAFAVLFRSFIAGEASRIDKVLVFGFLIFRLIGGLSSGWLGSFASIIVVCAAVYIYERRRIPRNAFLLVVLFTLFFQVSKPEFRREYWKPDTETSKIDRVRFWTELSLSKWEAAWYDPSGLAMIEAINSSLSRVSLLTQTANVIDLTPDVVPYQGTQLYSYLWITWIPRALWPDKPSMNEANQFYQVAYGLTTEEGSESVSIGVGVMTEAYISFGLYGVILIMFLMGVFYDLFQRVFFSARSGLLMAGLGVALLPQLMGVESQMAAYLGGIVQQVAFTLLFFFPVIRWRTKRNDAAPHAARWQYRKSTA